MVLNPDPITFETMHSHRLEPQLVSLKHVRMALAWAEAHEANGWPIHLKLDTGMHRLGLAPFEDAEAAKLLRSPSLRLASVLATGLLTNGTKAGLTGCSRLSLPDLGNTSWKHE